MMTIVEIQRLIQQTFPGVPCKLGAPGAGIMQSHEAQCQIGDFDLYVLATGDLSERVFLVLFTQRVRGKKHELLRTKLHTATEIQSTIQWVSDYLRGLQVVLSIAFRDQGL